MKSKTPKSSMIKTSESNSLSKRSKLTKSTKVNNSTKVNRRSSKVVKKSIKRKSSNEDIIDDTGVYNIENTKGYSLKEKDSHLGDTNAKNISIQNGNEGENSKYREFKCPDCNRLFRSSAGLRKHELSCYDFNKTTADINQFIASLKANGGINNIRKKTKESEVKCNTVSESITLSNESEIDKSIESTISETISSLIPNSIPPADNQSDKTINKNNDEIKNQNSTLNSAQKCSYCKKVFKTTVGFRRHEVNCKRKISYTADKISFNTNHENNVELKLPTETISNSTDALSVNVDRDANDGDCIRDISDNTTRTSYNEGEYHCNECGKLYRLRYVLQRHIRVEHNNECLLCGEKFPDKILRARHMLLNHSEREEPTTSSECHLCGKTFPDKRSLNSHLSIHSEITEPRIIPVELNPECHLCGVKCFDKEALTKHMFIHSGFVLSESESNCQSEISDFTETLNETILYNEDKENEVKIELLTGPVSQDSDTLGVNRDVNVNQGKNNDPGVKDVKESSNENKFECNECGKLFRVKSSLERHIRVVHSKGNSIECPQCGAKFPDKGALARHMYTHTGLKPYSCPVCKQEFSRKYHLVRHNMQTGCDGKAKAAHPCQVCGREFSRKDNLREHLRAHAGQTKRKRKYSCDSCGIQYETVELLKMHRKDHIAEREYACDFCPKKFPTSGALKKHRRTHTGEKPYECQTCDKKFAAKETLNRHIRIHTGHKPHTCQYCGKSFIQSTQLRNHIVYHTGTSVFQATETFVCDLCGKKFNRRARLNEHVKFFHLGAKPYECVHCEKTFIRKEDLNRHLVIHSGVRAHQCPICTKSFTMKSTLKVHLLTHTKEPPRSCDACGRAFIRQDCLIRHMKSRHREMLEEIKSEAEKKKLQQQLLQVAAEASLVEGMEERKELDEDGLVDAVRELLTLLVDETTLRGLGWPDAGVEALLEAVIRRCGHDPAPTSTPRHDRLRHNIKLLFTVVIDDSAVKALLNNQTVDEVILHVLRLAKS